MSTKIIGYDTVDGERKLTSVAVSTTKPSDASTKTHIVSVKQDGTIDDSFISTDTKNSIINKAMALSIALS